jgi:hypothetical protein
MDRLAAKIIPIKYYTPQAMMIIQRADAKDLLNQAQKRLVKAETENEKVNARKDIFNRMNNLFMIEQNIAALNSNLTNEGF